MYDFASSSVIVFLIDGISISVNVIRCAGFSFLHCNVIKVQIHVAVSSNNLVDTFLVFLPHCHIC